MLMALLKRLLGKKNLRREGREFGVVGQVEIKGKRYPLDNWSSSGFAISGYDGALLRGDKTAIRAHVELDGDSIDFESHMIVVRVDLDKGVLGGVFIEMDRETRLMLANYFDG